MDILLITFQSITTLILLGFLGFWITKRNIIPSEVLNVLSPLAIDIALPCLIFYSITTKFNPDETPDWWLLPLWWIIFTIIIFILSKMLALTTKKNYKKDFSFSLFYQNGIFIPFAVLSGISNDNANYLASLFLFTILFPTFFFNTFDIFYNGLKKNKKNKISLKKILNPVMLTTIVSIALKLTGLSIYIPEVFSRTAHHIGQMSIPLLLIIIGGTLYLDMSKRVKIDKIIIFQFIIYKNIIFPAIFLIILYFLKPAYYLALIITLEAAVPPLTAVPILVERAGGNRDFANQFLVTSFFVSTVTIPIAIYILHLFYK